jgi:GR25 family glycosyltransferase involved in LPS biosynthesis
MRKYIIARFNEDLAWLNGLPNTEVIIYNKGSLLPSKNVIELPNIGRESHTYLTYIIANYSYLPEVVVFSQGYIHDHVPLNTFSDADYLRRLGDEALEKGISNNFSSTAIALDWNIRQQIDLMENFNVKDPTKVTFGYWFKENFGIDFPATNCKISYGSVFAMRRDKILSRPKHFYARLLAQHSGENAPIEAHFLERSWYYIPLHNVSKVAFYAICLKDRQDRFEKVNAIKTYIPALHIVEAFDAAKFSPAFIQRLKDNDFFMKRKGRYVDIFGRPYQMGAVGCFLSHRKVLEQVLDQRDSQPYAIVLEDDVTLLPHFHENIEKIVKMIEDYVSDVKEDFDIVNLYVNTHQKHMFANETQPKIIKAFPGLCGTLCYLVKKSTVQNVLNILQRYENPIDEQLSRGGLRYIHLVGKEIIASEVIPSYIQNSDLKNSQVS